MMKVVWHDILDLQVYNAQKIIKSNRFHTFKTINIIHKIGRLMSVSLSQRESDYSYICDCRWGKKAPKLLLRILQYRVNNTNTFIFRILIFVKVYSTNLKLLSGYPFCHRTRRGSWVMVIFLSSFCSHWNEW